MAGRPPSEARAAEMRRVLAELDRSDLSTKAFCERRGIGQSLVSYWRKRLAESDRLKPSSAAFVPVHVVERSPARALIVELPEGARIHVPPGFDAEELRRLLRAVASC
jgi:transposase-like protein